MEFSSFSSPELGNSSSEKKEGDDKESGKDSKKKKSGQSAAKLAGIATETSLSKTESRPAESERKMSGFESLLQKLRGENKPKDKELPLFGIPKPEADTPQEAVKSDVPKSEEASTEEIAESSTEEAAEESVAETGETEELTPEENEELKEAAWEFTEVRLREADDELHELPLELSDTPQAAESAAQVALLRAMQERLSDETPEPIGEALDDAERVVAEHIETEPEEAPAMPESVGSESTEMFEEEALAETLPLPSEATNGNNGEGGGGDDVPPTLPPSPLWPGNREPFEPQGPDGYTGSVRTAEHAPDSAPSGNERAALGQGLLVGGVAGYFIGRHRGRKQGATAAERLHTPVRKNLERQIRSLQEVITTKETRIKTLAREKIQTLQSRKDREKFVNHMLQTPVERPMRAERQAIKPEAVVPEAAPRKPAAAPLTAGEVYTRSGDNKVEALGEIPLAAAAGVIVTAPVVAERLRDSRAEAKLSPSEIVPFNKKAEEFTREELLVTAEKVKVDGTSLKEMAELGQLDERGLRRVVGEFIRGGDVKKAVAHEIKEKELRYEQDPRMRHAQDAQTGGVASGIAGAGGLIVGGLLNGHGDRSDASQPGNGPVGQSPVRKPQLDPAMLREIRNKQIATVTVTGLVIVAVIILAIVLT